MTHLCDAHAFGCGCTERCTKTVDLGRFDKTAPVFTFTARDTLIVAAFATAFALIIAWMIQDSFERVRLANQETAPMVTPYEEFTRGAIVARNLAEENQSWN